MSPLAARWSKCTEVLGMAWNNGYAVASPMQTLRWTILSAFYYVDYSPLPTVWSERIIIVNFIITFARTVGRYG